MRMFDYESHEVVDMISKDFATRKSAELAMQYFRSSFEDAYEAVGVKWDSTSPCKP